MADFWSDRCLIGLVPMATWWQTSHHRSHGNMIADFWSDMSYSNMMADFSSDRHQWQHDGRQVYDQTGLIATWWQTSNQTGAYDTTTTDFWSDRPHGNMMADFYSDRHQWQHDSRLLIRQVPESKCRLLLLWYTIYIYIYFFGVACLFPGISLRY